MKEQFKQTDIDYWDKFSGIIERGESGQYSEELKKMVNHTDIDVPCRTFINLIYERTVYSEYLPYEVEVKWMEERGEDTYWTESSGYVGINTKEKLVLYLRKDHDHSAVSLLWILLHEFRHKIQYVDKVVQSNVYNDNITKIIEYLMSLGHTEDILQHVFHEVLPYEVDANMFACEVLGVVYPSSKFAVTDYTIGLLKK